MKVRLLTCSVLLSCGAVTSSAFAFTGLESKLTSLYVDGTYGAAVGQSKDAIVLKNDSFQDGGGQAFLQMGFVAEEKAGVWVKVPENIRKFKIDFFRVLMGSQNEPKGLNEAKDTTLFFQMGIAPAGAFSPGIPADIENAASVTPGPFWNDIPAKGESRSLPCAAGGELVGAALEFTHSGSPSIYRDLDGLSNPQANTLFAIPGGWGYSLQFGLRGDWVLRVVGHEADDSECGS